jgi:hypothetical protein
MLVSVLLVRNLLVLVQDWVLSLKASRMCVGAAHTPLIQRRIGKPSPSTKIFS